VATSVTLTGPARPSKLLLKAKPAKEKDGLSAAQRRERDAAALQAKQAKKQGAEAGK